MKSGIRYAITDPQYPDGHDSYWILSGDPSGVDTNPIRPEYLCKMSGHPDSFRILATRTLYWERDGTLIESEWRRVSGAANLPPQKGGYEMGREVSREEAVAILLAADKVRKS